MMRERFIVAPGMNGTELLRNMALRGKNCFNVRICGSGELAQTALIRSGISIKEEIISVGRENALIAKAAQGEAYFGELNYSDVQELSFAVKRMRELVDAENEGEALHEILSRGIFKEKNKALWNVYEKYIKLLNEQNELDKIGLLRKAIAESTPMVAEFVVLKEYPLSPLEEKLCSVLSEGNYAVLTVRDLYEAEPKALQIESYKNCYGSPNEVEAIIQNIYESEAVDKCVVAVTDAPTYSQLFFDYALLHNIPVTFGCGIPIINANPAKLLALYNYWITEGYFSGQALLAMIRSRFFDRSVLNKDFPETGEDFSWSTFYSLLKGIRFTNEESVNKQRLEELKKVIEKEAAFAQGDEKESAVVLNKKKALPLLEIMGKSLALPVEKFIEKYAYIRKGSKTRAEKLLMNLDRAAVTAIYEELSVVRASGISRDANDIMQAVLKKNIYRESCCEGALHITDIGRAMTCVREKVYVAGLSATKFPGSPKENYLLLDADIKEFGEKAMYRTSDGKIMRKREMLMKLVQLAAALDSKIYVSYAGLNVSDLKKDNASSLLYELYREEIGRDVTMEELEERVEKVGYFEPAISANREVGKAYIRGLEIGKAETDVPDSKKINLLLDNEYSPTALSDFFECPRKFMFRYILHIPEPEDVNALEVISAKDVGILIHSLMEKLVGSDINRADFIDISRDAFNRYIVEKPPVIMANVSYERAQFLEMMENAYEMKPTGEVVSREEKIIFRHESGVILQGIPDCVECIGNNIYRIVDYKTGRTLHHTQNDIDSCLQIVIYAYLMESAGFRVTEGVYQYLRLGEEVTCRYDDAMKKKLDEKLTTFKNYMENAYFPCADGEYSDACKYCKYSSICGKY